MDEGTFWIAIWKIAGAVLVCVVATFASCTGYQTHTVKEMVRGGVDPLRAACAINQSDRDTRCAVLATK